MPMPKPKKTISPVSLSALFAMLKSSYHCRWGLLVLLGVLIFLSILSAVNFEAPQRLYVAGQVASSDVVADRDILIEDIQATRARRKQVLSLQPPLYDLSLESYTLLQNKILDILRHLNLAAEHDDLTTVSDVADKNLLPGATAEILKELSNRDVQYYILKRLLPFVRDRLAEGLVEDIRTSRSGRSGVIIRNLDNNTETLRPDLQSLPDIPSLLAELSVLMRQQKGLDAKARNAINFLLSSTLSPSMTLNREATKKRGDDVVSTVEPVYYQIQKGELVLRKGERVSREQQIKLQSLYQPAQDSIQWSKAAGASICALILSIGFFMTPSGKPASPLYFKDVILISVLLLFFGIAAKIVYLAGIRTNSISLFSSFCAAFPVGGAVGLVAMVFAARRYCTMGLLTSFFCMLMLHADYPLFFFYFLSGMLATLLITSAQSRQDVVWSIIPLTIGQMTMWCVVMLFTHTPPVEIPIQLTAVTINALLSLILLFAVSPVLEMAFGYSTRFRLMELMSLEQPLMQDLMVKMPGTYHHSLVVANMVEAGAKAIGANSLLCKVAALYHDIGKLSYPEYFIENQFGGPNKHDRLAPSMSALILLSHVKKGTELADRYNLGQEITDIIRQHHGTRLMRFFYHKALNIGEKPRESDFSYPGPRPQTKEAAILMLADSVEASSRTLSDPTPARIKSHIDNIIKGIFAEGQLDESELTFKDLHYLSENFLRILTGIFHQRIAYPESKGKIAGNLKTSESPKP